MDGKEGRRERIKSIKDASVQGVCFSWKEYYLKLHAEYRPGFHHRQPKKMPISKQNRDYKQRAKQGIIGERDSKLANQDIERNDTRKQNRGQAQLWRGEEHQGKMAHK